MSQEIIELIAAITAVVSGAFAGARGGSNLIRQQLDSLHEEIREMHGSILMAQEVGKEALTLAVKTNANLDILKDRFDKHASRESSDR